MKPVGVCGWGVRPGWDSWLVARGNCPVAAGPPAGITACWCPAKYKRKIRKSQRLIIQQVKNWRDKSPWLDGNNTISAAFQNDYAMVPVKRLRRSGSITGSDNRFEVGFELWFFKLCCHCNNNYCCLENMVLRVSIWVHMYLQNPRFVTYFLIKPCSHNTTWRNVCICVNIKNGFYAYGNKWWFYT